MTQTPAAVAACLKVAAVHVLRGRTGVYDLALLDAFRTVCSANAEAEDVALLDLVPGMVLVEDVRSSGGMLLRARGNALGPTMIERLQNFPAGFVNVPARVRRI